MIVRQPAGAPGVTKQIPERAGATVIWWRAWTERWKGLGPSAVSTHYWLEGLVSNRNPLLGVLDAPDGSDYFWNNLTHRSLSWKPRSLSPPSYPPTASVGSNYSLGTGPFTLWESSSTEITGRDLPPCLWGRCDWLWLAEPRNSGTAESTELRASRSASQATDWNGKLPTLKLSRGTFILSST